MRNHTQPKIDFYILSGDNPVQLKQFCCRLAEKAWKLGNTIFVKVENDREAKMIDDLMWTYNDNSFLPHATHNDTNVDESPITIGSSLVTDNYDLLINLSTTVPDKIENIKRIAELVNDNTEIKSHGRKRYTFYDNKGYALEHHKINA